MPPRRLSLDDVLRIAEGVLRASRVEHVFVGGVTVLAFGIHRTTTDVDGMAAIEARQIPKIVAGFQKSGFFVSAQDLHDALTEGGHVTIQDKRSTYRIDPRAGLHSSSSGDPRTRRHVPPKFGRFVLMHPWHRARPRRSSIVWNGKTDGNLLVVRALAGEVEACPNADLERRAH